MAETNNNNSNENLNNCFHTPEKRLTASSIPIVRTPYFNEKSTCNERYIMPNVDIINPEIFTYDTELLAALTSLSKNDLFSQVPSKFLIKNANGEIIKDVTSESQNLKRLEKEKINMLENLDRIVDFKNSIINVTNLNPNIVSKSEEYIVNYPVCFETSSYTKFLNKKCISETKLSKTYTCQDRFNGKYFVVKSGHLPILGSHRLSYSSRNLMSEVKILTLIGKHIHIVDYFDSWIEDECFHIQLELVRGGSLLDFIAGNVEVTKAYSDISKIDKNFQISNGSAIVLLAQISSVLVYLHDILYIFHGDIKPSNILVELLRYSSTDFSEMREECHKVLLEKHSNPILRFKLCDFGRSGMTSKVYDMDEGDGRYLPAFDDSVSDTHLFATSRDIYSFGLTIYNCLGGIINSENSSAIRDGDWGMWLESISEEWQIIIQRMCHTMGIYRYSAREIIQMNTVKDFVLPQVLRNLRYDMPSNVMETN